jgi:uncharacterized membrane protein YecN with MAPEG domain
MESHEMEPSKQDAGVAILQCIFGLLVLFAILIPAALVYFVFLPMGWSAVWPILIMLGAFALIARVVWVLFRSEKTTYVRASQDAAETTSMS